MPEYNRCFTKDEAEEIKPYLNYYWQDLDGDLDTLYFSIKNSYVFRTPVIKKIAINYKMANPGERLPSCLKL
jgi:hypothetical protein